jgi:hypothetical protein
VPPVATYLPLFDLQNPKAGNITYLLLLMQTIPGNAATFVIVAIQTDLMSDFSRLVAPV